MSSLPPTTDLPISSAISQFDVEATPLAGLRCITRRRREDARGCFSRFFDCEEFRLLGLDALAQINHTITWHTGTVRGLHFQRSPHEEDKVVSCLSGEVFDVAVDIRPESPTFLRWHAERLSASNGRSLFIPKGFAHGFQTLAADCELIYLHSAAFAPQSEGGLNVLDTLLGITWPLPVAGLSERDAALPPASKFLPG